MKIVYIFHAFASKAGVERILSDKMNYLVSHYGYEVTFITYEQGNHPLAFYLDKRINFNDLDVRFYPLYSLNPLKRFIIKNKRSRLLKQKLSILLQKINPDYVVLTTYDFDKFNSILSLPYRFIIESHVCMSDIRNELKHNNCIMRFIAKQIDAKSFNILEKAARMVTLTTGDKNEWKERLTIPINVIPNFVLQIPDYCSSYSMRPNRILSIGRLTNQKGFDYLIKAWSIIANKYPTWKIDIFGHGELENYLHNMIIEHNLEQSIQIKKPTDRIFDEYNNSSIFLMGSRYEGFALVLIEAMSFGIPCISFDCPHGPSDLITHREDGLLVPLGDIKKMADAIEWMITHEEERLRMSNNAREKAKQYTAEAIMPQWVELFEKVAKQ